MPAPSGRTFRELYRQRNGVAAMNAPNETALAASKLSRRAETLGTENAFVVLAEVNALVRQGKDIVSFCIGQPDFPTPKNIQKAGIAAIKAGKHGYTPSAGIDELRAAAAKDIGARRGLEFLPDDVVVGAGAKPFIAYTIASVTDYGAGDEVIYPVPGFPIYESQILANGAVPVPIYLREAREFAFDPADLEAKITPQTKLLILNTPHNPDGRHAARRRPRRDRGDPRAASAGLGVRRRNLLAPRLRRRVRFAREPAGDAGANDRLRWRFEDVGDDGLAHRLRRQPRAGAGVHALDHEHRFVRVADLAVGRRRGDLRPAGRRRGDARELPRAPRSHRRPPQQGARDHLQDARRRVLRVAERHRGLPNHRAAPIPRCFASAC